MRPRAGNRRLLAVLAVAAACAVPPRLPRPDQGATAVAPHGHPAAAMAFAPVASASAVDQRFHPDRAAPAAHPVAPVAAGVAAALARIESQLGRGEVHAAMAALGALCARAPDDVRVRARLSRLLHQRALGRYGAGAVAAAIADWEEVLRLAPDHAAARTLLATACIMSPVTAR
ncbi:MAG: hypothetical protein FJ306_08105 [Planctomycetes bacterium]|nr:hypothetical protein [Planctomycetota bacterium]